METVTTRDTRFSERTEYLKKELLLATKRSNRLSNIRGLFFLSALICIGLWAFERSSYWLLILGGILFCGFVAFVIIHAKVNQAVIHAQTLLDVHNRYKSREIHDFSNLPDDGNAFNAAHDDFSADLDLFGKDSLFQLICVAHTSFGRSALASLLTLAERDDITRDDILKRQKAIEELSSHRDVVENMEASTVIRTGKRGSPKALLQYLDADDETISPIPFSFIVISIVNCVLFWGSLFFVILSPYHYFVIPVIFFLLSLALVASRYTKNRLSFTMMERIFPELRSYSMIFRDIEVMKVESELLKEIQLRMGVHLEASENITASQKLTKLYRIGLFIQARCQPLLFLILNVIMPYDALCIRGLEKWRKNEGKSISDCLLAVGDWEALMSLSTLSHIYPEDKYPNILPDDAGPSFVASQIGHPLIPVAKQVRNDFSLNSGSAIITGSNMSGKTTLLRTVGINACLAYAGAICTAKTVSLSFMRIGSSMRIADQLSEGISTFYAELLKISRIVKMAEEKKNMLYLIDEIFRGTNSRDRTDGAYLVLEHLHASHIIGLMSTHDYELCSLAEKSKQDISYYSFTETYDDGLKFDYVLNEGVSTSSNARYLMKMLGID